jgi:hypothetical protein
MGAGKSDLSVAPGTLRVGCRRLRMADPTEKSLNVFLSRVHLAANQVRRRSGAPRR